MQAPDVEEAGGVDGVAGAVDVGSRVVGGAGREVVEGGEVEEVLDRSGVLAHPVAVEAERGSVKVSDDGNDAIAGTGRPLLDESVELRQRGFAHQQVQRRVGVSEQHLDEVPTDQASGAGHEDRHRPPWGF